MRGLLVGELLLQLLLVLEMVLEALVSLAGGREERRIGRQHASERVTARRVVARGQVSMMMMLVLTMLVLQWRWLLRLLLVQLRMLLVSYKVGFGGVGRGESVAACCSCGSDTWRHSCDRCRHRRIRGGQSGAALMRLRNATVLQLPRYHVRVVRLLLLHLSLLLLLLLLPRMRKVVRVVGAAQVADVLGQTIGTRSFAARIVVVVDIGDAGVEIGDRGNAVRDSCFAQSVCLLLSTRLTHDACTMYVASLNV